MAAPSQLLLVLVCASMLCSISGEGAGCSLVSPFAAITNPDYVVESLRNLSAWRSQLLKRAHQRFRSNLPISLLQRLPKASALADRDRNAWAAFRIGLPLFRLYHGFVQCPPPLQMTLYSSAERKNLQVYAEGGKWACGPLPPDCIVYSLGSRLDFRFEQGILNSTTCKVWTFDCTVPGVSILEGRHFFEQLCIGDQPPLVGPPGRSVPVLPFARLEEIMQRLGHKQVTYLKMDVESSEFDIVERWHEEDAHLPLQIGLELHKWRPNTSPERDSRFGDIDMFMRHMAGLGYAVMIKEDNPGPDRCCAEMLLVRVGQLVCPPAPQVALQKGLPASKAIGGTNRLLGAGTAQEGEGEGGFRGLQDLWRRLAAMEHALQALQSRVPSVPAVKRLRR